MKLKFFKVDYQWVKDRKIVFESLVIETLDMVRAVVEAEKRVELANKGEYEVICVRKI